MAFVILLFSRLRISMRRWGVLGLAKWVREVQNATVQEKARTMRQTRCLEFFSLLKLRMQKFIADL